MNPLAPSMGSCELAHDGRSSSWGSPPQGTPCFWILALAPSPCPCRYRAVSALLLLAWPSLKPRPHLRKQSLCIKHPPANPVEPHACCALMTPDAEAVILWPHLLLVRQWIVTISL